MKECGPGPIKSNPSSASVRKRWISSVVEKYDMPALMHYSRRRLAADCQYVSYELVGFAQGAWSMVLAGGPPEQTGDMLPIAYSNTGQRAALRPMALVGVVPVAVITLVV